MKHVDTYDLLIMRSSHVFHAYIEGIWEESAEESISASDGGSNRRLQKTA